MKFNTSCLAYVVITVASTIAVSVETRKKLTLLVGNPDRPEPGLASGRLFIYLVQFISKNGRAIIEAASAQKQTILRAFIEKFCWKLDGVLERFVTRTLPLKVYYLKI